MEDKVIPEAVFQVGVVVRSVDETLKKLKDCFEIDTDSIQIKTTKDMAEQGVFTDASYNGKPAEFYIKTARLNFGGVDLEYVEPMNQTGGYPFSDWLLEHGQGIHHINIKMKDRGLLDRKMQEQGVVTLTGGKMRGKEFEFYDWRDTFGFIAEIGDMVVGPMAEEYYKTHEDNR